MLMRAGFSTRPRPVVEFDCGSQSTSSVLTSAAAREAARLMAVVVLPTPPFWLATAMTRPMILFSVCCGSEYANACAKSMPEFCGNRAESFHVKHSARLDSAYACVVNVFHVKHIATLVGKGDGSLAIFEKCFT